MQRFAVAVALVAAVSPALADPADAARAEVLFRQGRELMAAGKLAEACAAFEESQKLGPATSTVINLAACREKQGALATAWGLFLEAEGQTRTASDDATKQLHDVARDRAVSLEQRVPKLEIDVPDASRTDGLEITRGTSRVDAAMWNHALPIDGGTYTITAQAPGKQSWSTQVTIANEADQKQIEVPPLRATEPAVTPPPSHPAQPHVVAAAQPMTQADVDVAPPPSSRPTAALAVGAGSLVLLGGALAFHLSGNSTYDQAKRETTSQARRDTLYDSANTKRYVAEGMALGGVVAGAAAAWLYVRHRHEQRIVVSASGVAYLGHF